MKLNLSLNIFVLCAVIGCASVRQPAGAAAGRMEIAASQTDPSLSDEKGPHAVYWNPLFNNGRLLITFAGTNSPPSAFADFSSVASKMGYAVIGIDYDNSVITTSCRESKNRLCFDEFRENLYGPLVQRITALLNHLSARDSHWQQFLNESGAVQWDKVVLAGHSQGSGHAAYLAKKHRVQKVIMIAGPQDHFGDRAAPWLKKAGKTEGSNYLALLHKDDFFDSRLQLEVFKELCRCKGADQASILVAPVQDPHNALMSPRYRNEWAGLLTTDRP